MATPTTTIELTKHSSTTTSTSSTTFRPRMRRLGKGRWLIESRSLPGVGRQCTVHACSCPAFKLGGKMCWHRKLTRQAEAWLSSYTQPQQPTGRAALTVSVAAQAAKEVAA